MSQASPSQINALDAAAVKHVTEAEGSNQTATRNYPITVSIFEQFGRAFIGWSLDPNYAIGDQDVVQLREGSTWNANFAVTGPSGHADTGHVFGSGLNASYWSWNYKGSPGWRQLVITPNT